MPAYAPATLSKSANWLRSSLRRTAINAAGRTASTMGIGKRTAQVAEHVREIGVHRLRPSIAVITVAGLVVADLGGVDVHWAPVGTWFGALGTFAAVTVALVTSHGGERLRQEDERLLQARRAAAWMGSERVESGMDRVIIENGSKQPLHEVVLTIVVLHGSGPHTGEEVRSGLLDPVPGGVVTPGRLLSRVRHSVLRKPEVPAGR